MGRASVPEWNIVTCPSGQPSLVCKMGDKSCFIVLSQNFLVHRLQKLGLFTLTIIKKQKKEGALFSSRGSRFVSLSFLFEEPFRKSLGSWKIQKIFMTAA